MGADTGRVYAIDPLSPAQVKAYETTLYDDKETEESACGSTTTVGPTAEFLSGLSVWQLIRWFAWQQGGDQLAEHEIVFALRPSLFLMNNYDERRSATAAPVLAAVK